MKTSNPPWVNIGSAGWVNIQSAPTARGSEGVEFYDALLEDSRLKAVIDGRAAARCSPALMRRAISNLLSNAIRFTAPGESIKLLLTEHGRIAEIAVANPGPPIPAETQERMFSRFYQADPARARSGDSHGLVLQPGSSETR